MGFLKFRTEKGQDRDAGSGLAGHVGIIVLAGIAVYSNALHAPFVFDDMHTIVDNPLIRNLHYFIEPAMGTWSTEYYNLITRYLGFLTFAVNYRIGGLDVTGYHMANLMVHIASSLLVYALTVLSFRTPALIRSGLSGQANVVALFPALLFAVHPVQTQAVTYIAQRFASLATLFYLLSMVMYVRSRIYICGTDKRGREGFLLYSLSVVSAVFAMTTKEIAFTLPFMVCIYEFIFLEGDVRRRALLLAPFLLTLAVIPVLHMLAASAPEGEGSVAGVLSGSGISNISRSAFHFTEIAVVSTYIRLIFLPVNQNLYYDYPIFSSLMDPVVLSSSAFLLSIIGLAIYLLYSSRKSLDPDNHPERRLIAFGILWFFITLLVESSIIPRLPIFEHRVYLPSAGAFLAVTISVFSLSNKALCVKKSFADRAVFSFFSLVIALLAVMGYTRNGMWQDGVTLWNDVISKNHSKAVPHTELGKACEAKGLYDAAEREYRTAMRLQPEVYTAYYYLGSLSMAQKKYDEAAQHFRTTLSIVPRFIEGRCLLARAYEEMGRNDQALQEYLTALRMDPNNFAAQSDLIGFYLRQGKLDEAIKAYAAGNTKRTYDHPSFHNSFSLAYFQAGRYDEAVRELDAAFRIDPYDVQTHYNFSRIYVQQGRNDDAVSSLLAALRTDPYYSPARIDLAGIYAQSGRYAEALKEYGIILKYQPENEEVRYNMGNIYAQQGAADEAIREYQTVIKLNPGHIGAHNNLAGIYVQQGKYEEALRELRTVEALAPDLEDLQYNLKYVLGLIKK